MELLPAGAVLGVVTAAGSGIAAVAVLCGAAVLLATRLVRVALPVLLDLLLAAGLLRLALADSWTAIGTAAAVVALRKVAVAGLTRRCASTAAPPETPSGSGT